MVEQLTSSKSYLRTKVSREIKKALTDVTPPVLTRLFAPKKIRRPTGSTAENLYDNRIEIDEDGPKTVEFLQGSPVLYISVEKLRYSGGVAYVNPNHPMRLYYREGLEALRNYYTRHQPTNIFEKHFLKSPMGRDYPSHGVPWSEPACGSKQAVMKEKGLSAEDHGVQHYGPVSEEKLMLEKGRLDDVRSSFEKSGYQPRYGFSVGYFLRRKGNDWVFVIVGGQHRVAAMAELGFTHVPAQFQPSYPRIVREGQVNRWPMVRNNELTAEEAHMIFEAYFPVDRDLVYSE